MGTLIIILCIAALITGSFIMGYKFAKMRHMTDATMEIMKIATKVLKGEYEDNQQALDELDKISIKYNIKSK